MKFHSFRQDLVKRHFQAMLIAAKNLSKAEPHRVFYIVAKKCPFCHRCVAGFEIHTADVFGDNAAAIMQLRRRIAIVHDGNAASLLRS